MDRFKDAKDSDFGGDVFEKSTGELLSTTSNHAATVVSDAQTISMSAYYHRVLQDATTRCVELLSAKAPLPLPFRLRMDEWKNWEENSLVSVILTQFDLSDDTKRYLFQLYGRLAKRKDIWIRYFFGKSIYVEGLIGAGKSTLCKIFHLTFQLIAINARVYLEHKNKEYLELFKSDMGAHALGFQMYMITQRILSSSLAVSENLRDRSIQVFDRSLFGDRAFEQMHAKSGNITPEGDKAYLVVLEQASKTIPPPDYLLKLEVNPDVAHERTEKRDDVDRGAYDRQYYLDLDEAYEVGFKKAQERNTGIVCYTINHDQQLDHFEAFGESQKRDSEIDWANMNVYLCISDAMDILDRLVEKKSNWTKVCLID